MNFAPFSYLQSVPQGSATTIPVGFSLTNAVIALQGNNPNSYTPNASSWTDLSGNNNTMQFYSNTSYTVSATSSYSADGGGSVNMSALYGKSVSNTGIISNNSRTFCGWVKFTSFGGISVPLWIGGSGTNAFWEPCSLVNGGINGFCIYYTGIVKGTNTFVTNTWYYLVTTSNSTNNATKLYVNNTDVTPVDGTATVTYSTAASPAYIGDTNLGPGNFKGLIGMMSLYNVVLSAQTIADNYNNTKAYYGY